MYPNINLNKSFECFRYRRIFLHRYVHGPCPSSARRAPQFNARQTPVIQASSGEPQSELAEVAKGLQADISRQQLNIDYSKAPVHGDVPTTATLADPPGYGAATAGKLSQKSPYKDLRTLDAEILSIGLPMLATLAADPIAGLVDSAYMGRAGSSQLAAVGVALSIFNTATKLFNVPLLAVTTSAVAKATGEARRAEEAATAAAAAAAAANSNPATATSVLSAAAVAKLTAAEAEAAPDPTPSGIAAAGRDETLRNTPSIIDGPARVSGCTTAAAEAALEAAEAAAAAASTAQARAASSCIWLAGLVGLLQAGVLLVLGPRLVSLWGVAASSSVAQPALGFLLVRAAGAPVTILMLTLQGVFRGLQDTRTPLQATLVSNALNIALAPILVFGAGLGATGAAVATVTAQAIPLILMAGELRQRLTRGPQRRLQQPHEQRQQQCQAQAAERGLVSGEEDTSIGDRARRGFLAWGWSKIASVLPLFRPTGFLVLRSASVTATYAVATTLVARAGAAVTASHQICFQLWLACSLLADALAVAAQSLMARDLGAGSVWGARQVAARTSSLSLVLGLVVAGLFAAGGRLLPGVFSSDPEVLRLVSALFPIIAATQPITVLAMAWDGILYGAGGFRYAAVSMALAALPAIAVMLVGGGLVQRVAGVLGAGVADSAFAADAVGRGLQPLTGDEQLWLVWLGLAILMLLRWLTIAVPYATRIGPFRQLRNESV